MSASSHDALQRILCLIPVRGGSKGIPRKNLAELTDGVSLLEWTIRQALETYPRRDIFVSSDDVEMLAIASAASVNAVSRPPELAGDSSTTASVVDHLLHSVDRTGDEFDAIAILQVTSPLRTTGDIRRSMDMIASGRYDSVVGAFEERDCHPAKMYYVESGSAVPVAPVHESRRRQDLPKVFRRNGAIFVVTMDYYRRTGKLWGGRTGLVEMPRERSVDVDAPADLEAARRYLSAGRGDGSNPGAEFK